MSRFKVGDKVRYKSSESQWYNDTIRDGAEGEVVGRGLLDNEVLVCFPKAASNIPIDNLELLAPADKKREFLERLQSLMREFDAKINIGVDVESKIWNCGVIFDLGNDRIFFPVFFLEEEYDPAIAAKRPFTNYPITADNIMDFDKE